MTTYTTKISKNHYGLTAKTEIDLNKQTEEGAMKLQVTSSKHSVGTVSATATVIYRKDDHSYSTMLMQDYSKSIARAKIARVTAKSLEAFHIEALKEVPNALKEVAQQYNMQGVA